MQIIAIKHAQKPWSFTNSTLPSNSIAFIPFKAILEMLVYSSYRKVEVHDDLVEDVGPHLNEFQDIRVLNTCAPRQWVMAGRCTFVMNQKSWTNVYEKIYWVIDDDE